MSSSFCTVHFILSDRDYGIDQKRHVKEENIERARDHLPPEREKNRIASCFEIPAEMTVCRLDGEVRNTETDFPSLRVSLSDSIASETSDKQD